MKLHHKSRQSGFTLIELLAVVAILGILAGIAVPRVLGAIQNARVAADAANIAMLQSAVERWAVEHGQGGIQAGWRVLIGGSGKLPTAIEPILTTGAIATALVPSYINDIPVAPAGLRTLTELASGYALQFEEVAGANPARWTATVVPTP